jgi:hypothetical protein
VLYVVSALVAIWCSTAHAKITIRQAEYTGGMLLVRGETARPGQTVTLANRYKTRTDRNRRFRFRVRYLPQDCLADVRAGLELYLISICELQALVTPNSSTVLADSTGRFRPAPTR